MTVRNAAYFVLSLATLTFAVAQQTGDGPDNDQLNVVISAPAQVLSGKDVLLSSKGTLLSGKEAVTRTELNLEVLRATCEVQSGFSRTGGYCI